MTPQYCLAKIDVSVENSDRFNDQLKKVMGLFDQHGWRLQQDLQLDRSFAGGEHLDRPNQYLHLWKIPNLSSLLSVMVAAADSNDYIALDAVVEREEQHLGMGPYYDPWRTGYPPRAATCPEYFQDTYDFYLLEEVRLHRSPVKRNEYMVEMNGVIHGMRGQYSWDLLHAISFSTGTTNRCANLWGLRKDNRSEGDKYYRSAWQPLLEETVQHRECTWWRPVTPE